MKADDVARAIVAASRETGADPIRVAMAIQSDGHHELDVARTRSYAAFALGAAFPDTPDVIIARAVGSGSPVQFMASLRRYVRNRTCRWWDDAAAARVLAAVENGKAESVPTPRPEPANAPAPAEADPPAVPDEPEPDDPLDVPPFLPGKRPSARAGSEAFGGTLPPRPAATPGKRDLLRMLQEAVANTAALPKS